MRSIKFSPIILQSTCFLAITLLMGCSNWFTDPLKDKESGDKITLLVLDRNFIHTTIAITLRDMNTREVIDDEPITIWILGKDSSSVITFTGEKNINFLTSSGYVEIGCDPNRIISETNPMEFTVLANSATHLSPPQYVTYSTEGVKSLTIYMARKNTLPASLKGAYNEPYDLYFNGDLNADDLVFVADISAAPSGLGYDYLNLYQNRVPGPFFATNLKDPISYADYGLYFTHSSSYGPRSMPPGDPIKTHQLNITNFDVFSTVLRSGLMKCNQGLQIIVNQAGGGHGTGIFNYQVAFADGRVKTGQITCTFPDTALIEQIYYPISDPAVTITLSGDEQFTFSAPVTIPTVCGGMASFIATPRSGLTTYSITARLQCPDDESVAYALSIIAEFRKSSALPSDPWTAFEFLQGSAELQLKENEEYTFRINLDSKYHSYTLPMNPASIEAALNTVNPNYDITELSINQSGNTWKVDATVLLYDSALCDLLD